jgi:GNAT superfamily N-acetyltransferase
MDAALHEVRAATEQDAPEIARLLSQLGHPTVAHSIVSRWQDWIAAGNVALVMGGENGSLSGVATLHHMTVLHRPKPVGRITALIVDEPARGRGVGRALVAAAEASAVRAGCGLLEITSNARLTEAHAFYEHLGYQRTSARFAKTIG